MWLRKGSEGSPRVEMLLQCPAPETRVMRGQDHLSVSLSLDAHGGSPATRPGDPPHHTERPASGEPLPDPEMMTQHCQQDGEQWRHQGAQPPPPQVTRSLLTLPAGAPANACSGHAGVGPRGLVSHGMKYRGRRAWSPAESSLLPAPESGLEVLAALSLSSTSQSLAGAVRGLGARSSPQVSLLPSSIQRPRTSTGAAQRGDRGQQSQPRNQGLVSGRHAGSLRGWPGCRQCSAPGHPHLDLQGRPPLDV